MQCVNTIAAIAWCDVATSHIYPQNVLAENLVLFDHLQPPHQEFLYDR